MADMISRRNALGYLSIAAAAPLPGAAQTDICGLTAVAMASLLRKKKLSARDVMAAHLRQIERVNPQVNAIVTLVADQAMESARQADEAQARGATFGPLHGLPIGIKDLEATAGIRTTSGSRLYKDHIPHKDAIHVERLK